MDVLVVSPQEDVLDSLTQQLQGHGFSVKGAGRAKEVERTSADGRFDVIVLDATEARRNAGKDSGSLATSAALLRRWRRLGIAGHILIVLFGDTSVAQRVQTLDAGADDLVSWPIHVDELAARLRALTRREKQRRSAVRRVHDLEIDADRRLVRRGGKVINLTAREFKLLQLLAEHRGAIVSRDTILKHLYRESSAVRSNVVEVYIRFLRKKIDHGFDLPLIMTRWGQGYVLRGEDTEVRSFFPRTNGIPNSSRTSRGR